MFTRGSRKTRRVKATVSVVKPATETQPVGPLKISIVKPEEKGLQVEVEKPTRKKKVEKESE